jgi:hypothetical protein
MTAPSMLRINICAIESDYIDRNINVIKALGFRISILPRWPYRSTVPMQGRWRYFSAWSVP